MPEVLRNVNNGEPVLTAADVRKHLASRRTIVAACTPEEILWCDLRSGSELRCQILNRWPLKLVACNSNAVLAFLRVYTPNKFRIAHRDRRSLCARPTDSACQRVLRTELLAGGGVGLRDMADRPIQPDVMPEPDGVDKSQLDRPLTRYDSAIRTNAAGVTIIAWPK